MIALDCSAVTRIQNSIVYSHVELDQTEGFWSHSMCQILPYHLLHCWSSHKTTTITTDGDWGVGWEPKFEDIRWCVATECGHRSVERGEYFVLFSTRKSSRNHVLVTVVVLLQSLNCRMVLSVKLHVWILSCMWNACHTYHWCIHYALHRSHFLQPSHQGVITLLLFLAVVQTLELWHCLEGAHRDLLVKKYQTPRCYCWVSEHITLNSWVNSWQSNTTSCSAAWAVIKQYTTSGGCVPLI